MLLDKEVTLMDFHLWIVQYRLFITPQDLKDFLQQEELKELGQHKQLQPIL